MIQFIWLVFVSHKIQYFNGRCVQLNIAATIIHPNCAFFQNIHQYRIILLLFSNVAGRLRYCHRINIFYIFLCKIFFDLCSNMSKIFEYGKIVVTIYYLDGRVLQRNHSRIYFTSQFFF